MWQIRFRDDDDETVEKIKKRLDIAALGAIES